jgi:hypothetical protein
VEYKDFLLAIKKFLHEGKMMNSEGLYTMHPEVINEVRVCTPTPALKKTDLALGSPKSSKISNTGKKQKVKPQQ